MPVTQLVDLKHAQSIISTKYKNKISVNYGCILHSIGAYQLILDTKTNHLYVTLQVFTTYYENLVEEECPKLRNCIHERDIGYDRYKLLDIASIRDIEKQVGPVKQQRRLDIIANETSVKNKINVKIQKTFCDILTTPLTNGHKCISIDFECFERVQSEILEIGYTIFDENGVSTSHHLIIKEKLHRKNKDYVPNNRNYFNYGTSETLSLSDACVKLDQIINDCQVLVFHNYRPDCNIICELLGSKCFENKTIFDTSLFHMKMVRNKAPIKLCNLAKYYGIYTADVKFHNAGNDSHITALCLLQMQRQWRLLSEKTEV
jgi:hypothetical protein